MLKHLSIKSPDNKLAVIILSNQMILIPTDFAPSCKFKNIYMLDRSLDPVGWDINTETSPQIKGQVQRRQMESIRHMRFLIQRFRDGRIPRSVTTSGRRDQRLGV
ncbi:hypothetical protein CSC91_00205 [Klebsiella pneumoniae]|nr:hypothetical protein CSC91_00205 [Klebsiella pneumoniae]